MSKVKPLDADKYCHLGMAVIEIEAQAVQQLASRIDHNFSKACEYLLHCTGRIIVIGMGKSGHIGSKIAATFASTGSPAFFVHPAEASHGDLGMITRKDVVLAISNSGNTHEIVSILPIIKRQGVPLITLTGNTDSAMAEVATVNIDVSVEQEACPLGLAPTSSTTASLVMGDALAVALLEARGFTKEDFALSHPGGILGRRLLLHIEDIMRTGEAVPIVSQDTLLSEALVIVTQKGLGMTGVVDQQGQLVGIFTDGDLRRTLDKNLVLNTTEIASVMTTDCVTLTPHLLAAEALKLMETNKVNSFIVVDENRKPIGALNMQDLLKHGVL